MNGTGGAAYESGIYKSFCIGGDDGLSKEFGMNVMREQLDLHSKGPLTGSDVNTIIGVTGQLEGGQVIYTFEEGGVAIRIASALVGGRP